MGFFYFFFYENKSTKGLTLQEIKVSTRGLSYLVKSLSFHVKVPESVITMQAKVPSCVLHESGLLPSSV